MKPGDLVVLHAESIRKEPSGYHKVWLQQNIFGRPMLVLEQISRGFHFLVEGQVYYLNGDWCHLMTRIDAIEESK